MKNLRTIARDIASENSSCKNRSRIVKKALKHYSSKLLRRIAKVEVKNDLY